ncbi:MAG: hypothetical protein K0S07_1347 [Chlamydiales bacterium]|nr:hypothetical protein [Chlamydiales bacterium]
MSTWLATLTVTFVLIAIALLGLGIGRLLTGKNRISKGCGSPVPEKDGSCKNQGNCSLCQGKSSEEHKNS